MNKAISIIIALFQIVNCWGQSKYSTDSSVEVIPHWKKGDSHAVILKSTVKDISNGKATNYISTFQATFSVLEKDTSGYVIEWIYTKANVAIGDVSVEDNMLANLVNVKIDFNLSEYGRFKGLVNTDEFKIEANKAVDKLIRISTDNPAMNFQFKSAKQFMTTKQGLEIMLLKEIKMYNLSFGFNYKTNFVQKNKIKLGNSLGKEPFDAVEKVQLTKLDNTNNICVIETSKVVDVPMLQKNVIDYLVKNSQKDTKTVETQIGKDNLELTESTFQQIDFLKGIPQKTKFTRNMNFSFLHRTTILELETIE